MSNEDKEKRDELLRLVRAAVQQDKELREKYNIGDKFRFIRDRLNALLSRLEESFSNQEKESERQDVIASEDEALVYVYLYNAQGNVFKTWNKMLTPSVFYEHSINRPIYSDKSYIEGMIRGKQNKLQHGYLTIAVKKANILSLPENGQARENPVIKVKENSLQPDRLVSFTHNGIDYVLNERGELVKKEV